MTWWESAYRSGHVNWDPGEYDAHLPWLLGRFEIRAGSVIDLGCGTGKSAVWLAERGFDVLGIDLAPTAIRQAQALAQRRGVKADFRRGEFPADFPAGGSGETGNALRVGAFDLAIERGFLQHFDRGRELQRALRGIAELLRPRALFYSLITAREGNRRGWGNSLWSEAEIRAAMHELFLIRHMELSVFTPGETGSMPAWVTVMSPK